MQPTRNLYAFSVGLSLLTQVISYTIETDAKDHNVFAEGPACPIKDPLPVDGRRAMNITLPPLLTIEPGSFVEDCVFTGLSTLKYDVSIVLITLTARFEVTITTVEGICSNYNSKGNLDVTPFPQETIASGPFEGNGVGEFHAKNVHVKGSATVSLLTGKVQLSRLNLEDVSFDELGANLENYKVNGEAIDWDKFNANIKSNFDRDLQIYKDAFIQKLKSTANAVLQNFTLQELIDLIGGSGEGDGSEGCEGTSSPGTPPGNTTPPENTSPANTDTTIPVTTTGPWTTTATPWTTTTPGCPVPPPVIPTCTCTCTCSV